LSKLVGLAVFTFSAFAISISLPSNIPASATAQEIDWRYPLLWPSTYFDFDRTMMQPIVKGDEVPIIAVIENQNRIAANVTFITQIVDSADIVVAIQELNTAIYPTNQTIKLTNIWRPEEAGFHRVEAFLITNEEGSANLHISYLIADKWATATLVRPQNLDDLHNLGLEITMENPENVTAGLLKGSVELVNHGNGSEIIKVDPESDFDVWPVGIPRSNPGTLNECGFWSGLELNDVDAFELPAHGRMKVNYGDTISIPYSYLDHADSYELSWIGRLRLQEPDGVQCMYVHSEKVRFNVTAPKYEGINLVLSTDKQLYGRNETIRFAAQVQNTSDKPFEVSVNEMMIHIQGEGGGKLILTFSGVSDIDPVVIPAHSKYTLDYLSYPGKPWSWDWDQRNYTTDGIPFAVEPGRYLAYATFSSPPMKSETIVITIG
jgi:hypothetical protein